jgi:hypothetical protein
MTSSRDRNWRRVMERKKKDEKFREALQRLVRVQG